MGSTLSCWSVATTLVGCVVFAAEAGGAAAVARGGAAGAEVVRAGVVAPESSVANCSTFSDATGRSAAVGSTFGQATREFIFSARRACRSCVFALATVGCRFTMPLLLFIVGLCAFSKRVVLACAAFGCSWGGCNPAR